MSNYMNPQRYKNGDWVKCVMFVGHEQHPHKTVFHMIKFLFRRTWGFDMKKIKKIVATLLTATMVFNLGMTGAFASTDDQYSFQPVILGGEITEEIISKADPYIDLGQNGLFEISNYDGLSKVLTVTEIELVEEQISNINIELRNSINASDIENISVDESSKLLTIYAKDTEDVLMATRGKEGVNKIEWRWFGIRVYLSKSVVNHILNAGVAAGAAYIGIQFPGVGIAIATAISAYLITEFGTQHISRAIYVDVGLKLPNLLDPGFVGIRGFGFQWNA